MTETTEQDLAIEVEDEPQAGSDAAAQAPPRVEPPEELADLKRQIESLKASEAKARAAQHQAEQTARERAEAAARAETQVRDSRVSELANAIDAAESQAQSAERAYADAMSLGDHLAAAKAQRQIAAAEAKLLALNNGKAHLEEQLSRGHAIDPRFSPQYRAPDPVEDLAARVSPASAAWLRANPRAASNVNKLMAAHHAAVGLEGHIADTPEYFRYIEEKLGLRQAHEGHDHMTNDHDGVQAPLRRSRPTPVSAPVAASSQTVARRSDARITLSSAEREIARQCFPEVSHAEAEMAYAKNKLALQRDGKIS